MPRRPHLALPGIPWHIIQRGVNRSTCFFSEEDCPFYLRHLGEYSRVFGCDIHAYVLMTNHVLLLLTPKEPNSAGRMMKRLGQRYVQYINRINGRSGTLWEVRFRSCLTQTEEYVLACYRYIELNPVRAGMVAHPRHYGWSSYATNGEGEASDLISPHGKYLRADCTESERLNHDCGLFNAHMDPDAVEDILQATNGNFALGHPSFQAEIQAALEQRSARGKAVRPRKVTCEDGRQLGFLEPGA